MINNRAIRLVTAALVVGTLLLSAQSALASKQAIVNIKYNQLFFGYTYYTWSAWGEATVSTPSATPMINFPSNVVSVYTNVVGTGPYTDFFSIMATNMNRAGAFSMSHAGVAASGGSTIVPVTSNGGVGSGGMTTKCFASVPPFSPGGPALPGSCFPRGASAMRTPGAKKFGGSARLIRDGSAIATRDNFTVGGVDTTSAVI